MNKYIYNYNTFNENLGESEEKKRNIIIISLEDKSSHYKIAKELLTKLYKKDFSQKIWKAVDIIIIININSLKQSGKDINMKRYAGPHGITEAPELVSGYDLHIDIDFFKKCCDDDNYEYKFYKALNNY